MSKNAMWSFLLCFIFLTAGCSTGVHIDTKPEGVSVRINGKLIGNTPARTRLSDFDFNGYDLSLEKEGYKPLKTNLEKEFKVGAFVTGFFLGYFPWLWVYGPKPYYYFELEEQNGVMYNTALLEKDNSQLTQGQAGVWKNDNKLKIVVMDFDSSTSSSDGKTLAELFSVELVNRGCFIILDRSQLQHIIDEQKLQLSGITEEEKVIKIGQIMGANKIITGSVLKMGNNYFITLKGIDVYTGSVEVSDRISSLSINGLINSIPIITDNFIYKALGKQK